MTAPRKNMSKKLVAAVVVFLGALTTAVSGYYGFRSSSADPIVLPYAKPEDVAVLKRVHDADIADVREQIKSLRTLSDALLGKASSSEAKLDMLIGLVRDHMQEGAR